MYCLLNEYVEWWYVAVALVIWVPLFIAVTFFIVFFTNDNEDSRAILNYGCLLVIISVSVFAAWNTIYFNLWYKNDSVYTGTADSGYFKQTKRQFIVWSLFSAFAIDAAYAYFICVTRSYSNRRNKNSEKKEEKKADD